MLPAASEDKHLLIDHLAQRDALFSPHRQTRDNGVMSAAISERRSEYLKVGLPMVGGGDGASRVAFHRRIVALRDADFLTMSGTTRTFVKLTDRTGEAVASLVGAYTVAESWSWLKIVNDLTEQGLKNAGCVPEYLVAGNSEMSAELASLEYHLLPLLARGWLDSASDLQNLVGYAMKDAGKAALAAGPIAKFATLPKYSETDAQRYDRSLLNAEREMKLWKPSKPGMILIPLSAGNWPKLPSLV